MLLYYNSEFEGLSHQITNNISNIICRWLCISHMHYQKKNLVFAFFFTIIELSNSVHSLLTMYLNKFRSLTFWKVITLWLFGIILFCVYFNFINKFFWEVGGSSVILAAAYLSFFLTPIKCEWMLFMVLVHSSPISIYSMLIGILQWEL